MADMTIRIEDLKAGMKVKLVDKDVRHRCLAGFVTPMEKYLGTVCTIKSTKEDRFRIEEDVKDMGGWYWNLELIEKIIEDKKEIKIEDLKVGMKVKLVDEEPSYHITGGFTSKMRKFLGGVYTVRRVFQWDGVFSIAEDKNNYIWDVRLVDEIIEGKKEIKREDLKAGMKIKFVDEKPSYHVTGGFNDDMNEFLGKICTVSKVNTGYWSGETIDIKEDNGRFIWDFRLIESIVPTKMEYKQFSDMLNEFNMADRMKLVKIFADSIVGDPSFEKCIINEKCVIVFLKDKTGVYKGVAKCCDDDTFDICKGFEIALLKASKKCLDKKLKDACK